MSTPEQKITRYFAKAILFIGIAFAYSCENKVDEINKIIDLSNQPALFAKNIEIVRTDSGKIILKGFAPEFYHYKNEAEPYTEMPQGLKVVTYNQYPNVESGISADYAIYWENKQLWLAQRNVIATNIDGDTLQTEELYWDENTAKIYSDKFCRITTKDGVFYGEKGFEADQSFKKWKLKNTKGTVNVKDE